MSASLRETNEPRSWFQKQICSCIRFSEQVKPSEPSERTVLNCGAEVRCCNWLFRSNCYGYTVL